jgi:hypothetical protein
MSSGERWMSVGLGLFEKSLNFGLGYSNRLQDGPNVTLGTKLRILRLHGVFQHKHKLLRHGAKNLTQNENLYHGVTHKRTCADNKFNTASSVTWFYLLAVRTNRTARQAGAQAWQEQHGLTHGTGWPCVMLVYPR